MNRTQRRIIWVAGAGALLVAGVAGGLFIASKADQSARADEFVATLRADRTASLTGVPDDQLRQGFESRCSDIAEGRTLADEVAAAHYNWSAIEDTSPISLDDYLANVKALYNAAAKAC